MKYWMWEKINLKVNILFQTDHFVRFSVCNSSGQFLQIAFIRTKSMNQVRLMIKHLLLFPFKPYFGCWWWFKYKKSEHLHLMRRTCLVFLFPLCLAIKKEIKLKRVSVGNRSSILIIDQFKPIKIAAKFVYKQS